jgi:oligosaccharyltransferase complex subunit alpha (ribophorin I)
MDPEGDATSEVAFTKWKVCRAYSCLSQEGIEHFRKAAIGGRCDLHDPTDDMRLIQWAALGLTSVVAAVSNESSQSRNLLSTPFSPPQHFRNVHLVRNINLERSYAKELVYVVIENISKEPQQEYYLPFDAASLSRIGGLEVKDKNQPQQPGFVVDVVGIDAASSTEYYKITLPLPLAPNDQSTLAISYYILSALEPLPAKIDQAAKQYVRHKFSAFALSAYTTIKQKTKLKLPTTDVPDAVTLPASLNAEGKEDPQKQGTTYTYGPYGEQPAGAVQEVSVRYEFTKPLTHVTSLERDVEISHWGGNIATEERFWLINRAATLKNQFSRLQYQQTAYYNPASAALKELRFPLVAGSVDPYYTDEIGNVTTSHFRANGRESNLEIKPRYPLYGGWNYSFRVGWNSDLKAYVRKLSDSVAPDNYVLKVPFFEGPKQSEGIEYECIVTRVILPEGAT